MQLDAKALAEATAEIVKRHVAAATEPLRRRIEALESRPAPERGEKGDRGEFGEPGRDGVGIAGALIDRSGVLVLTLSDGTTRELGVVVGRDGEQGPPGEKGEAGERGEKGEQGDVGRAGADGKDGVPGERGADGCDGRDGLNGRDGKDGLGFDDLVVEQVDERSFKMVFAQGDHTKEFAFSMPTVLDRGVFKAEREAPYRAGDAVTWAGSLWIAQRETLAKPDTPDSGWRLAVKRGRDGKDGKSAA